MGSSEIDPKIWKQLIAANYKWWQTGGALADENPFSDYDRDAIIEENGYSPDLLIALNRHIITLNSQRGKRDNNPTVPHPNYVRQFEEHDVVPKGLLTDCPCTADQRPYLQAIAPEQVLDRFRQDFPDIGVFINGSSEQYTNATFDALRKRGVINVSKSDFLDDKGNVFCTIYPTNIWTQRYEWRKEVGDIPAHDLRGLEMITFVGIEYEDDGGAMMRKVLELLEEIPPLDGNL